MTAHPNIVYWTRGAPASGKSTWARKVAENTGALRLNLDSLREMFAQPWSSKHEHFVQTQQDTMGINALRAGKDVIFDNTNIRKDAARRFATLAWEAGFNPEYHVVDFSADVDALLARNQARRESRGPDDSQAVPDDVIRKMSKQIDSKRRNGDLWTIADITAGLPEIEPYRPPTDTYFIDNCLIADLDGSLAIHNGRDPYDAAKCGTDLLNDELFRILDTYAAGQVILLSGRSEDFREATEQWLKAYDVFFDHLYMRASGDDRRDSVVKLELFNDYIRNRYIVEGVFDDRLRCAQLWHQLGLPLFRVGDPSATF
jgi:predicted kinase